MNRFMRNIGFYLLIIFIAITFIDYFSVKNATTKQEMGYSAFLQQVDKGEVAKVTMMNNVIEGVLTDGTEFVTVTPDAETPLFYNPDKGSYYHRGSFCYSAKSVTFTPFTYGELEDEPFRKLKMCPYCAPEMREAEIEERNAAYAEGTDHDELLTSLRQAYYEYLQKN